MTDITHLLDAIDRGDPRAAEQLLPLVYAELRRLAAAQLAREKPGQTLDATALVHEAYLRLVGAAAPEAAGPEFANRRHFFAAAAEAMRRILVENARRKASLKRGGGRQREELPESGLAAPEPPDDLLALDEALTQLATADPLAAELVQLRYFAGLTSAQAAAALGISERKAERTWAYARSWLFQRLRAD
jgi:RNA polymerase sigma factor (TIGR02999 family)